MASKWSRIDGEAQDVVLSVPMPAVLNVPSLLLSGKRSIHQISSGTDHGGHAFRFEALAK